jgi:hypothetical protein
LIPSFFIALSYTWKFGNRLIIYSLKKLLKIYRLNRKAKKAPLAMQKVVVAQLTMILSMTIDVVIKKDLT